jgi:formylglycine-generating enzyme required for sulfatase activity
MTGKFAEGMQLAKDYLSRTGYRLPTEAEWEYACRAGAMTRRYYGYADDLLEKYAWYTQNSQERTWPVGSLKPNDLGLFDMHGHLYAWCQERETSYPSGVEGKVPEDTEDSGVVSDREPRLLRGGSFNTTAPNVRSALRYRYVPGDRGYLLGFRVARTFR